MAGFGAADSKVFVVGEGLRIDPEELYLCGPGWRRGGGLDLQASMVAGDYHSGPLSTIIPLGLWGAIAFLWLLGAGVKVLYRNYRYGDPALQNINAFFLAFFIAQSILYFGVFGAFEHPAFYVYRDSWHECLDQRGSAQTGGKVPAARAAQPMAMAAPLPAQA